MGDDFVPDAEDLLRWVENHNIQESKVLKGSRNMIDISGNDGFPLTSWPTFVFIDKEMVIYHGVAGWSADYMNQKLTEMLVIESE